MKILLLGILFFHIPQSVRNNVIEFLNDYTNEKNIMVTLHNCWNKTTLKEFSRIRNTKYISAPNNFTDVSTFHNNIIVMDLNNCERVWRLLFQVNQTESFGFPNKYLILVDNVKNIEVFLRNFTIYPSSDVTIAEKNGSDFKLHQIYRISSNTKLIWEKYGYWSHKLGLNIYLNTAASERRHNFKQENLRVMFRITNNDTWNHLEDFRYPRTDSFTKLSYGSTKSLLDYLNVKIVNLSSELYGYKNESTGEFSGLVGALGRREVDLAGSAIFVTTERSEVIEYMTFQSPISIRFMLKKPPLSYVKDIFVLALNTTVWVSIVIVLSIFGVVSYFVLNVEAKERKISHKEKFSASDVALISLEAVCQQGTTTDPTRVSGRILALIFFMAFMFIYVAYSAKIVAMLQLQVELKSPKELLDSKLDVGSENTNYMKIYITENKDEIGQQLYKKKIGKNGFYTFDEGMKKMRKGFFAFLVELAKAYNYILDEFTNYEICCLQEIEGYFQHLVGYSATQKNSPYKEIFKTGFLKVDEYGLTKRNFKRYSLKPSCHLKGATFESIGLIETRIAFLLFAYGIALASLLLLIEILVHYLQNCNQENSRSGTLRKELRTGSSNAHETDTVTI